MSERNKTKIDNAKDMDIAMPMYNLIEYSDNYSKTYRNLWQYHGNKSHLDTDGSIADFPADNNSTASVKFLTKIAGTKGNYGTKTVKIRIPTRYLNNFWKTLEMLLINCEIIFFLIWSPKCFTMHVSIANQVTTFTITDTKLHFPVVTSTQDNEKLLQQLKSGFKRAIK